MKKEQLKGTQTNEGVEQDPNKGKDLTSEQNMAADGSGSSSTTAQQLVNDGNPNLRTTLPLDFDQRHNITANIDYRYGSGKKYNGPILFGQKILQNFGINVLQNYMMEDKEEDMIFENEITICTYWRIYLIITE